MSLAVRLCRAIPAGLGLVAAAAPAQAHGFAQRYDLPVPLWLYLAGAGATVALSFAAVAVFARRSIGAHGYPSLDLLRGPTARLFAFGLFAPLCRVLSVALFVLIVAACFWGTEDPFKNIAPTLVWVIWWVGLAYVSALLGHLWLLINPWSVLFGWAEAACRWLGGGRALSWGLRYPERLGVWPSVALVFAFAWIELVWQDSEVPARLGLVIVGYSVLTWAGMLAFGREVWLARGEAFTVAFGLFARFAPTEPRADGSGPGLALRPPGIGLLTDNPVHPSMMAFVILMLATVSFDGFTETPAWVGLMEWTASSPLTAPLIDLLHALFGNVFAPVQTLYLLLCPLLFFATYWLFSAMMARAAGGGHGTAATARRFVLTLVPISIAYHIAHYLSFLLVAGQLVIPLSSDPLGLGWDLFGTTTYLLDIGIVGPRFVWITSVIAIVVGHVVAVYLAHAEAGRTVEDPVRVRRSQYPMLLLMVGYTMVSLWILAQPVVAYSGTG